MRKYDQHCLEFFWEFDLCTCMLMRVKFEICPVWGKLEIKFPVRTKETDVIMVLPQCIYWYMYIVLVYIYIHCLLFICKLFKGLKIMVMYVYTTLNCVDFWFRCMLTLSFLDRSIYYITRQRASLWPSAWERVKEEGQSVIDL